MRGNILYRLIYSGVLRCAQFYLFMWLFWRTPRTLKIAKSSPPLVSSEPSWFHYEFLYLHKYSDVYWNLETLINSASFSWFVLFSIPNKRSPFSRDLTIPHLGSYLIHLFGVRFLLWTGRIPIKYQRTAVQKLFRVHHLPRWCGRSREVTWSNKNGGKAEMELKLPQTLALKQGTLTGIVPVRPFPVLSHYQTRNCYFCCSRSK